MPRSQAVAVSDVRAARVKVALILMRLCRETVQSFVQILPPDRLAPIQVSALLYLRNPRNQYIEWILRFACQEESHSD